MTLLIDLTWHGSTCEGEIYADNVLLSVERHESRERLIANLVRLAASYLRMLGHDAAEVRECKVKLRRERTAKTA